MLGRIRKRTARNKHDKAPVVDEFGGFAIPGGALIGATAPAPGECRRGDGSFAVPGGCGGVEEGVYWAYASFSEDVQAVRATGEDVGADVEANGSSPVLVPAGTRARLHYPMRTHGQTRFMKYARVDADTGQFTLYHVPVYAEVDGGVCRYVEKFES
jgi:hypothetical protein